MDTQSQGPAPAEGRRKAPTAREVEGTLIGPSPETVERGTRQRAAEVPFLKTLEEEVILAEIGELEDWDDDIFPFQEGADDPFETHEPPQQAPPAPALKVPQAAASAVAQPSAPRTPEPPQDTRQPTPAPTAAPPAPKKKPAVAPAVDALSKEIKTRLRSDKPTLGAIAEIALDIQAEAVAAATTTLKAELDKVVTEYNTLNVNAKQAVKTLQTEKKDLEAKLSAAQAEAGLNRQVSNFLAKTVSELLERYAPRLKDTVLKALGAQVQKLKEGNKEVK